MAISKHSRGNKLLQTDLIPLLRDPERILGRLNWARANQVILSNCYPKATLDKRDVREFTEQTCWLTLAEVYRRGAHRGLYYPHLRLLLQDARHEEGHDGNLP